MLMHRSALPVCLIAILFCVSLLTAPAAAQQRHALVIGIDDYDHVEDLRKARNDARAVAAALEAHGFETILRLDSDLSGMFVALSDLVQNIDQGDEVVFYFAGHGVEIEGLNYLLPADVPSLDPGREVMVQGLAIPLNTVVDTIRAEGARVSSLIIDACRDNPFARRGTRSLGGTRGLARSEPPEGTFILYSAGAGQAAMDELPGNDPDPNSVFARNLLQYIDQPGIELRDMVQDLRRNVRDLALTVGHRQTPAYYDQLIGEFYFYRELDWISPIFVSLEGHDEAIYDVAFSPDGRRLVTVSGDHTGRVWNVETGTTIATLAGHNASVRSAVFSPDGQQVLTTSSDRTARLWDPETGEQQLTIEPGADILRAGFSPDGVLVALLLRNSHIHFYNTRTNERWLAYLSVGYRFQEQEPLLGSIHLVLPSITLFSRTSAAILQLDESFSDVRSIDLEDLNEHVYGAFFSPDGERVLTVTENFEVRLWDRWTGLEVAAITTLNGGPGFFGISFSPDSSTFVTHALSGMAAVWDSELGVPVSTFSGHRGAINSAYFSPSGQLIVTGSRDDTARVWRAQNGDEVATLRGHADDVTRALFSPNGDLVASASLDGTARIWMPRFR